MLIGEKVRIIKDEFLNKTGKIVDYVYKRDYSMEGYIILIDCINKEFYFKEDEIELIDTNYNSYTQSKVVYYKMNGLNEGTSITIIDEGIGPFIELSQEGSVITVDLEELELIVKESKIMLNEYIIKEN